MCGATDELLSVLRERKPTRPSTRLGRTDVLHSPVPPQSPAVGLDLQLDLVPTGIDAAFQTVNVVSSRHG